MKTPKQLIGTLIFTVALLFQVRAQDPFTNGLVAYYPFNGNANDAIGANNGTVFNAALASDRFGNPNHAYSFNGTNAYIRCPDTGLPAGNTPRTVSLWMKMSSKGVPSPITMWLTSYGFDSAASGFYSMVVWNVANPYVVVGKSGGGDAPQWVGPTTNVWYQVVITYTNGTANLYINGSTRVQSPRTYGTILEGNFYIARYAAGVNSATFHGQVDDVRIYNRALSASEVQQLCFYETPLLATLIKAVKPSFSFLSVGTNYQMQVSGDLNNWTNQGSAFAATNSTMTYPQYFDVDSWGSLYFRAQVVP